MYTNAILGPQGFCSFASILLVEVLGDHGFQAYTFEAFLSLAVDGVPFGQAQWLIKRKGE